MYPMHRSRDLLPGNGDLRSQQDREMGFCEFNQIRLICERTLGACMPGLSVQMPSGYQPFEILHKNDYDGFAFSYSTKIFKIRRIEA